jgi:hypothetical protein
MEREHTLRVRIGRFVGRGLQYAAQAVAGREGGVWPSGDHQMDAAFSRPLEDAGASAGALATRPTVAALPGTPVKSSGAARRRPAANFSVRSANPR